jgi:hypothetical protein
MKHRLDVAVIFVLSAVVIVLLAVVIFGAR